MKFRLNFSLKIRNLPISRTLETKFSSKYAKLRLFVIVLNMTFLKFNLISLLVERYKDFEKKNLDT